MSTSGVPPHPVPKRWARRFVIAAATLFALWLLAWLAVPPLVKWQAESRLSEALGRRVSIGRVGFSPWSLTLEVEQLRVARADAAAPQLEVGRARVDGDLRSLLRWAPVIEAIEVDAPVLRLSRLADGRYDVDDIVARFASTTPKPTSEPARFALYNLHLRGGTVEFDDRPLGRVHRLQELSIALPFLSNLPADVTVRAEPRVTFKLNGAPFDSGAQTQPFAQDRASQIDLAIADLDLAHWLPYLPASLPFKPTRGRFASRLQIRFELAADGAPRLSLKGDASLADVAITAAAPASAPVLAWQRLAAHLNDVQPLARRVALGEVTLTGARVDAQRGADGRINLAPPAGTSSEAASADSAGWQIDVEKLALVDARIDWRDAITRPAAALRLAEVAAEAGPLRWPMDAAVPLRIAARAGPIDGGANTASLHVEGSASERSAEARVTLEGLDLAWLEPYLSNVLAVRVQGRATTAATLNWAAADAPRLSLSDARAQLDQLRLLDSPRGKPAFAFSKLALADTRIDLMARQATVGTLAIERPTLALQRDKQGRWNVETWTAAAAHAPAAAPPASAAASPWKLQLGELTLAGGELRLADARPSADAPVRLVASSIAASVRGLSWPSGGAPARTQLRLRLAGGDAGSPANDAAGRIEWSGHFAPQPLAARGSLRIDRFPVHAFEPYFGSGLNVELLRAEANWRGDVAVAQRSDGVWDASANGDALLADVRVHERAAAGRVAARGGDELLSIQSLSLKGLRFDQRAAAGKPRLQIADAALSDFYSRLVITEDGSFNLRDVAAAPPGVPPAAVPVATAPAASAPGGGDGLPIDIALGGLRVANGRIDFSDRFIRPNYSAALSELNGTLGAFDSSTRAMATLDLKGRAAGTALLEISGSLNPTAQPLALDIRAKASDLELAPLSPYAGRYAGYAIERGKLSMDVAYKIDADGKLEAKNQVILNQLTFGDKVESPDATKLPVLLAVALLKDRNGVIDINLPVSGSINDPQFSVFGIVLKIIGNLLVKALTAPFALLAGGGGEDLSFVGFDAGTTSVSDSGRSTLDKVAKALVGRPALKMTVTGAADPRSEREAIQRAALDARLKAEQRRDALRAGAAADTPPPALTGAQREALVKRVYDDSKLPDKPRNAIGFAKAIPAAEMEALLLKATVVSTDSARELALQRGLAVRDALIAKGLPSERLFLAAPKLQGPGDNESAWSPHVQLSLSTN
jgi:uncharacterized protein involved in outer membrane biogenesis